MSLQTTSHLNTTDTPIQWFRNAAPYINMHRGKVFVIMFSGEAVEHKNFKRLIQDFALLKSLGIKLVLVHGARPQIDTNLAQQNIQTPIVNDLRITTRESLNAVLNAVGSNRLKIEAQLTLGLSHSPVCGEKYGERVDVVSGNYVLAKPYGVRDGVDYKLTGMVRSIDTTAILNNLANDQIVLLGSIGYSTTGEVFNLLAEQVAVKTAIALKAEKLIFLGQQNTHAKVNHQRDFVPAEIFALLKQPDFSYTSQNIANNNKNTDKKESETQNSLQHSLPVEFRRHLIGSAKACKQGVARSHIVSHLHDDSLLKELFTREGAGTLVSTDPYEEIQPASIADVVGLIALLAPLEEKGILVRRSREKLENEIEHFVVAKIDGMIVGCAALYPLYLPDGASSGMAEIACVAVHMAYRGKQRGEKLLQFLEQQAKKQGISTLFVLTTQTAHWFMEQGFTEASLAALPVSKQKLYNQQRNSKIYTKEL